MRRRLPLPVLCGLSVGLLACSPDEPTRSRGAVPALAPIGIDASTDASIPNGSTNDSDAGAAEVPVELLIPDETVDAGDAGAPLSFLRGVVWAPGNGPGLVPEKQEIPVAGALIELSTSKPEPLREGVFCEGCVKPSAQHTVSDQRGVFELGPFPKGRYWLSLRKGQFRLEREVFIEEDGIIELSSQLTTLPSVYDPARGQILPKMAVAVGQYDRIENVLGKMGIGGVTRRGAWRADGPGAERIDLYDNGGRTYEEKPILGTIEDLVRDYEAMSQYHVIFIPCSNFDPYSEVLKEPAVLRNIQRYVGEGGKLYVTDWSGHWHDSVFPAHIQYTEEEDTPKEAYDFDSNTWDPAQFGDTAALEAYDSPNSVAIDEELAKWLDDQWGPINARPNPLIEEHYGPFAADMFTAFKSYARITGVSDVHVGTDKFNQAVIDSPRVFVEGDRNDTDAGASVKFPLTVSYQPTGCGRVLYSTYHTTGEDHPGLLAQERILLYLIMEMTVCRPGLPPEPR